MSKKVEITDRIKELIAKNSDDSVDVSQISVFECISVNTLPISKAGTLYQGSKLEPALLKEMADYVNGGGAVPLHQIHDQGESLPVGRVFYSEVRPFGWGETELRSLFYLPNSETTLINKLELNVLDEVSVGVRPKQLVCCKCGFDFLGAKATWDNLWTLTCDEGHTIGEDGTFTYGRGLDKWMELSLVSKGAANNAKILSRTKQLLGEEAYNKLAASGTRPEATVLFATATKDNSMDLKELMTQLVAAQTADGVKAAQLATLTAEKTTLQTQLAAAQTEIAELKAKQAPDSAKLQEQLTASQAEAKTATDFIREEANRLAIAAGGAKLADTATLADLTASIQASRAKLAELPVGGRANPSGTGTGTTAQTDAQMAAAVSAFKKPTTSR